MNRRDVTGAGRAGVLLSNLVLLQMLVYQQAAVAAHHDIMARRRQDHTRSSLEGKEAGRRASRSHKSSGGSSRAALLTDLQLELQEQLMNVDFLRRGWIPCDLRISKIS